MEAASKAQEKKPKKFRLWHVYTIIAALLVVVTILTWIVPSGQYERTEVDGREVTVAGTYTPVDKITVDADGNEVDLRQGVFDLLMAPTEGIQGAVDVVAFVFIVGGSFGIITKTGAIEAGMKRLVAKLKGNDVLIIPISMILFSLGGTAFGMSEETLPFFAIFVPIMISMGFDTFTAFMVCFLGPNVGYMAGVINPFNTLVAQGIVGITGNPQLWLRCIYWVVLTAAAIFFVMRYALRVRKNPKNSIVYEEDYLKRADNAAEGGLENTAFTGRQKGVLVVFLGGMILMIWGLITQGWYMNELSGIYLAMGIISGIVGGLNEHQIAEEFVQGMKDFAYAAIIIGLARAVLVILEGGMVIDTVLYVLATALADVPPAVYSVLLYVFLAVLSLLVPSSSGFAALTMPIIGPLTELMGLNIQAAVTGVDMANKLANTFSPMCGVMVAGLAICGVPIAKWWKGSWPFAVFLVIAGIAFTTISGLVPA
ncbi:YfcC family protein [uncultured Enorma sp.]|uniref:YfcC family protein n=1 Tax=uncultured Enorma sp. TaxID=1714346 RepID=UPI00259AD82A|nr:YfcC family protein [uncultured Enorma sp.]